MNIAPCQTHSITPGDNDILTILDTYLPKIENHSIIAVTSKIVSLCEGRVIPIEGTDKDSLIEEESEYYLPREANPFGVSFTITHGMLVATAGIDESNGDGNYVLWPDNPQKSANTIREHIVKKHAVNNIGVIITDSRTTPMRWGVTAMAIAYSGIEPLKNYIGKKDLFGREFVFEKLNIIDSLATSAALVMGEGAESTPLAVITDVPFVTFVDRNPTDEELSSIQIGIDTDLYAPFLQSAQWKRGKRGT